ncbi:hypothetical protein TUM18999_17010 [Pseudomonas tohonis]|uniref:Uncharacterized protein n=1 Tax=Pseudomonas tohonis TaxID=2725477 RepID=A0A6J4E1H4_9PSED|nr:hypothetical protein TUM18999_17010 [Pseudomonas tohonis]GJN46965.1 hypothetical protein TUM20249_29510 [Pseudomonas tohonis]GJN51554.1 hypothetical protein TUM20286_13060 [Pseudomonas tohonis]
MRLLTAGWVRCRRSPASEKLPVSAMAMKALRLARSMALGLRAAWAAGVRERAVAWVAVDCGAIDSL